MFSRMPWQTGLFPSGRADWPLGVFFHTNVPNYPAYQTLLTRIDTLACIDGATCIDSPIRLYATTCIDSAACLDYPVVNTPPICIDGANVNTYAMCLDCLTCIDGLSRIDSVTCIDGAMCLDYLTCIYTTVCIDGLMCIDSAIDTNYLIPHLAFRIDSKRCAINHPV